MPFDGKLTDFVSVPTVAPFDFATASPDARLLELARWLEDEQAWRDSRMNWDFSVQFETDQCGSAGCALGLASVLWPEFKEAACGPTLFWPSAIRYFCMPECAVDEIFNVGPARCIGYDSVTPGMVATAIRKFVADRSAS